MYPPTLSLMNPRSSVVYSPSTAPTSTVRSTQDVTMSLSLLSSCATLSWDLDLVALRGGCLVACSGRPRYVQSSNKVAVAKLTFVRSADHHSSLPHSLKGHLPRSSRQARHSYSSHHARPRLPFRWRLATQGPSDRDQGTHLGCSQGSVGGSRGHYQPCSRRSSPRHHLGPLCWTRGATIGL